LSAPQISSLLSRFTWREAQGVTELTLPLHVELPLPSGADAGSEAVREVKRQSLGQRCALWLQTSLEPGAPATVSAGTFVLMRPERSGARVEAAAAFQSDEGSWGLHPEQQLGEVLVASAAGQDSGSGAQERSSGACLWLIGPSWINPEYCYASAASWVPLTGRGWSSRRKTVPEFTPQGVALATLVTLDWLPYPASCQRAGAPLPAALRSPRSLEYRERQALRVVGRRLVAQSQPPAALPSALQRQVEAWQLPPSPVSFGEAEQIDGVTCDEEAE
jgi:hypothetical protein